MAGKPTLAHREATWASISEKKVIFYWLTLFASLNTSALWEEQDFRISKSFVLAQHQYSFS